MARAELYPTWRKHNPSGGRHGRRGTTLIEILVVLALLAIGIFAIIRLFPQGFASINATGNVLLADTLAQKNEEYFRKLRENLPDGIISVDPAGNIVTGYLPDDFLGSSQFGTLTMQDEDGQQVPVEDPRFSLGNRARRIIGEQVKVPPPVTMTLGGATELASIYPVLCAPIYSAGPLLPGGVGVQARSGTPMTRVVFQDPPTQENWLQLRALGDFGYGINYEKAKVYLAYFDIAAKNNNQIWDRRLRADFRYHPDANTTLHTPAGGFPLQVAQKGNDPGWDPANPDWNNPGVVIDLGTSGAPLDPGSDVIYREFVQIPAGTPFTGDPDPYQFKVYDTVTGLLGFKPELATLPLPQQQGRGLTVKVDYDVDDWHVLRQDVVLPTELVDPNNGATPYYSFKLSTGAIKALGETESTVNFDTSGTPSLIYSGLVRSYPAPGPRPGTPFTDLIIEDLQTGYWIDNNSLQLGNVAGNGSIDYPTGVIHLTPNVQWNPPPVKTPPDGPALTLNPAGRHVRVFYRSYNEFSVVPVKAWTEYLPQPTAANLGNAAFRGQDYLSYNQGADLGYLVFPNAGAGKVVSVDYTWKSKANKLHQEHGQIYQVNLPTDPGAPASAPNLAWVHLSPALNPAFTNGTPGDPDSIWDGTPMQITAVRGASFQTFVTWREAKQWRRRQRSTMLTRDQTP